MKRCICHFVKWQIHPFISKGTVRDRQLWILRPPRNMSNSIRRKHYTLTQWCFNVGPASQTVGKHWPIIGSTYRVCSVAAPNSMTTQQTREFYRIWPLVHRSRRWPNIKSILVKRLVLWKMKPRNGQLTCRNVLFSGFRSTQESVFLVECIIIAL